MYALILSILDVFMLQMALLAPVDWTRAAAKSVEYKDFNKKATYIIIVDTSNAPTAVPSLLKTQAPYSHLHILKAVKVVPTLKEVIISEYIPPAGDLYTSL